jgi:hypothetical protein
LQGRLDASRLEYAGAHVAQRKEKFQPQLVVAPGSIQPQSSPEENVVDAIGTE